MTPDSFSLDGCIAASPNYTQKVVALAEKFVQQGADILDIGGESSRPGASPISVEEEIGRVIPTIKALSRKIRTPLSIDTYKSSVAQQALDNGASIVNNIRGIKPERSLLKMVCRYNAAIVLMHMRGNPQTMQKKVFYRQGVVSEVIAALRKAIENCLDIGIKSDKIIIDPGIGFGKTVEDNLEIINRLTEFKKLKYPILIGTSRKSFIGAVLNRDVQHRLFGTIATVCASICHGAHIVRVHDVEAVQEAVKMTDAVLNFPPSSKKEGR